MTEQQEAAMRQALEAFVNLLTLDISVERVERCNEAITALRQALESVASSNTSQECVAKAGENVHEQQPADIGALGMPVNVPVTSPGSATRSANSAEAFCNDNTEEMLIDAMRSTMAVAWGYLWHITTSDKRVIGARHMLLDMIEASGLTPEEFHQIKTYGLHTAKAEGCVANMHEPNWMG